MLRQSLIRLSQQELLKDFASRNRVAKGMARRFVAGETVNEALAVVRSINQRDMSVTLDHLGENVLSTHEAAQTTRTYNALLEAIQSAGVRCNVSLKLTALGLDLGDQIALENLGRILEKAAHYDNFVRIDMEGSEYVERTLDLYFRSFERFQNCGVVVQSYLFRTETDVERLIQDGARVRLVKGAYLEPPEVAFQDKADVDANFVRLTEMLLTRANYPAIATHDPAMIDATKTFAEGQGIDRSRFEFQMLYGIRRDLQEELAAAGYNVRVYVPFGTHWYPYLMRRLAERPANLMFVLSNIAREARGKHS